MSCKMIEKNNGYACGMHCELFKSESENMYSPKYNETVFTIECKLAGKMIFSVKTGKRLDEICRALGREYAMYDGEGSKDF